MAHPRVDLLLRELDRIKLNEQERRAHVSERRMSLAAMVLVDPTTTPERFGLGNLADAVIDLCSCLPQ